MTKMRTLFVVLLCVSYVTDILDGILARALNLSTQFGARLDSLADELTYVAALVGAFQFEYQALAPHVAILYAFVALLALASLLPLVKFRKIPAYHLYSFKANSLFQAIFFFCLFVFDFFIYLYYFVFAFGILACLELIAVVLILDKPASDAKGLFWVLSKKNRAG